MPIIQMDLKQKLNKEQVKTLSMEALEAVHLSIGSAMAHINIVIRHAAGTHIVEAGGAHEVEL